MYRVTLAFGLLLACLLVLGSGSIFAARPSSLEVASTSSPPRTSPCTAEVDLRGVPPLLDAYPDKVAFGQATATPTRTPRSCTPIIYAYSTATATIVPGVTDTGNHCDDCSTPITLPFAFILYSQTYSSAYLDSNGFATFAPPSIEFNECLPEAALGSAIFPYHDDLVTTNGPGCQVFPTGCGIFTSVSGSSPNRIFNVEWRTLTFGGQNDPVNFELRLHESPPWGMDFVYGQVSQNGSSATVGVQEDAGSFTQFSCNTPSLQPGLRINWAIIIDCDPTATPTRTRTPTPMTTSTPTGTPTGTPTPLATPTGCLQNGCTPTPIPIPTTCPMNFSDVQPSDYFYEAVHYLYCAGVVSGYADNTFRPYDNTTRGQTCKIIVLA